MAYYGTRKITAYYNGVQIVMMPYSFVGIELDTLEALSGYSLADLNIYSLNELK